MTTKLMTTQTLSESSGLVVTLPSSQTPVMVCVKHPTKETLLRCSDCMKPSCISCLKQTATGYKCKDCIEARRITYYNHQFGDSTLAALAGFLAMLFAIPALTIAVEAINATGYVIPIFLLVLSGFSSNSFVSAQLIRLVRWSSGYRYSPSLRIYSLTGIWLGYGIGTLLSLRFASSFLSLLLVLALTGWVTHEVNEELK